MVDLLVGLDLTASSRGALSFTRWLMETAEQQGTTLSALGVHVLDDVVLRRRLREEDMARVAQNAKDKAEQTMSTVSPACEAVVVRGVEAASGLGSAAATHGAKALIVGRQAPSREPRLVSLGRVARVALRELAAPTFVVPPDLDSTMLGEGPVLVAVDSTDASKDAVSFALETAKALGRGVELLAVTRLPNFSGLEEVVEGMKAARDALVEENTKEIRAAAAAWGMEDLPLTVTAGYITDEIVGHARAKKAPFVVVGSRRLGLAERLFRASVGTALACVSPIPVAVVPPELP